MGEGKNKETWLDTLMQLATEFNEKRRRLSEAIAHEPSCDVALLLRRHADATINAFRNTQSALFKLLGRENCDLELVRQLFVEMSKRFDEMQALFFAATERYDKDEKEASE